MLILTRVVFVYNSELCINPQRLSKLFLKPEGRNTTLVKRTCNNTPCVEQLHGYHTRLPERERHTMDKCLTGHSRVHHAFYIILLDNFMGPILKKAAQKKKKHQSSKLCTPTLTALPPPSPYPMICHSQGYFMLIYRVRGWELLLDCDTGWKKRDRSQRTQESGGSPMFVAFGSAAYFSQ